MKLRPYQQQAIDSLRQGLLTGHKRQMLYLPTGAGKTRVASAIFKSAVARGRKPLFLVHLTQLVLQAIAEFEAAGLKVGVLQGENTCFSQDDDVLVASIQTVGRRNAPEWCNLVIIDEGHILHRTHIELMKKWSEIPFIGLSATPLRQDLGNHFSNLVKGATVRELTDAGYLVPTKAFCPEPEKLDAILETLKVGTWPTGRDWSEGDLEREFNKPTIVADVVSTWRRHGEDRQTLVFAINKAHSRSIVEAFLVEGIPAAHIEDRTPAEERKELISDFNRKEVRVLSSVGVLAIGFDSPIASCGILARPTLSEALHMQQQGRLIRPCPEDSKEDAILLDHAGNVLRHGLPVDFEVHHLSNGQHEQSNTKKRETGLVTCRSCWYILEKGVTACPKCGVDRPKPQPNVNVVDGELIELGSGKKSAEVFTTAEKKAWYLGFCWYAEKMGYKTGWAFFKYREKFKGDNKPAAWRYEEPIPPSEAQLRWIKSQQIRHAKGSANKTVQPTTPDLNLKVISW